MKVAAFLASTIPGTVLILWGTFWAGRQAPASPGGTVLLAAIGLFLLIGAPAWLGFILSLSTPEARQSPRIRRVRAGLLGLVVIGAVAVAAFASLAGTGPLFPLAAVGAGALCTAVSLTVARRSGTHINDLSELWWTSEARTMVARKFAIVGSVATAAAALGITVAAVASPGTTLAVALESTSYIAQGVFLAAAFAAVGATFPLASALRAAAGTNYASFKRISKVVLRGKNLPLDPEDQLGAARMAAVTPIVLPLQSFGTAYIYASLAVQLLRSILQDRSDAFSVILLGLLVLTAAFFVPYIGRQVSRARRYADDHASLLAA